MYYADANNDTFIQNTSQKNSRLICNEELDFSLKFNNYIFINWLFTSHKEITGDNYKKNISQRGSRFLGTWDCETEILSVNDSNDWPFAKAEAKLRSGFHPPT